MDRFVFWQRWLLFVGLYLAVFGAVLALFPHSFLINWAFNDHINPHFGLSPEGLRFQAWAYGVLGATMGGWGVMIAFMAHFPFKRKEPWAWYALVTSLSFWFILDQLISGYHGVIFNVAFNTLLYVVLILPLLMTRRDFLASHKGMS